MKLCELTGKYEKLAAQCPAGDTDRGILLDQFCDDLMNLDEREVTPKKIDNVNHPKHYERPGAMECIDEMIMIFGTAETAAYCKLAAWKYRYRAMDKGGREDMEKSDWYIRKYRELMGIEVNEESCN